MNDSSWLVIVNPNAGYPKSLHWRDKIAARFARQFSSPIIFTEQPGHATAVAHAANDVGGFAVFGGDGTIAEIVNGMDIARQKLFVLGGGTGNGLVRDLGLHFFGRTLRWFRPRPPRRIDLIRVTFESCEQTQMRLVVSTAAFGYVANVVHQSKRISKRARDLLYFIAAIWQSFRLPNFQATIQIDGTQPVQHRLNNVLINNTKYSGNFRFFPRADNTDGCMDTMLGFTVPFPSPMVDLTLMSITLSNKSFQTVQSKSLTLRFDSPQPLMLDGEIWEEVTYASFEVLPRKLECMV